MPLRGLWMAGAKGIFSGLLQRSLGGIGTRNEVVILGCLGSAPFNEWRGYLLQPGAFPRGQLRALSAPVLGPAGSGAS